MCSTAIISRGRFSVEAGRFLSKQGVSTTIKHPPSCYDIDYFKIDNSCVPKAPWFILTWTGAINNLFYSKSLMNTRSHHLDMRVMVSQIADNSTSPLLLILTSYLRNIRVACGLGHVNAHVASLSWTLSSQVRSKIFYSGKYTIISYNTGKTETRLGLFEDY